MGLVDADVPRAGLNTNRRAATVDVPGDVMVLQIAVHRDWRIAVDGAGTGAGVERKVRATRIQSDGAGAGFQLPSRGWMTTDLHVAGAGFRIQSALNSLQVNAPAAGLRLDIVGGVQVRVNFARPSLQSHTSRHSGGLDGAGTGVSLQRSAGVHDAQVA